MHQRMKALMRELRREGYRIDPTRGGHVAITHPSMRSIVFGPSTPSDRRSVLNVRAQLRRQMRAA
jgi:hypothetical protein